MRVAIFTDESRKRLKEALPRQWEAFDREETEKIQRAMGPRGATPRARLEWLLDQFIFADITRLDDAGRFRLWLQLQGVVLTATGGAWTFGDQPWKELGVVPAVSAPATRAPVAARALLKASRSVDRKTQMSVGVLAVSSGELIAAQAMLRSVVNGLATSRAARVSLGSAEAFVWPGADRPGGVLFFAPIASAALVALAALLSEIRPLRLKRCAFAPGDGAPCIRVFVPRKRQRWCAEHQAPARREQLRKAQAEHRRRRTVQRRPRPRP